jgi:hypothetical protein
MNARTLDGPTVVLVPDWSPSINSRLARFDAIIKVPAGQTVFSGTPLDVQLASDERDVQLVTSDHDVGAIQGPAWRYVRGRLVEVGDRVSSAVAVLGPATSAPSLRPAALTAVSLLPIDYRIGIRDEPVLLWRYGNSTDQPLPVGELLARAVLSANDQPMIVGMTYNGPASLPVGRAVSGWWSTMDLEGLPPGPNRMQLWIGDQTSDPTIVDVPS